MLRTLLPILCFAACHGPRSALDPAGADAERILWLFVAMAVGAVAIWLFVVGLAVHATLTQRTLEPARARNLVIGGGTLLPTVVLSVLLVGGLAQMPALLDPGPADGLRVLVSAEQFWWRIGYRTPDGRVIATANELRLPVGPRTRVELTSADVVHSFWIPSLAGKMDAIPGRTNRLGLQPLREAELEGVCAEFCGPSHAHMGFAVVTLAPEAFEAWLQAQAAAAAPAALASPGRDRFLRTGCGACHTVRGTPADGVLGPDLTHVGSRRTLAGGVLPNDVPGFRAFLADPRRHKPGVGMPGFAGLPDADLDVLATWLESLQ
ncbi:MAG: c-type cytochrome [Myxococcota bacterium]